MIVPTPLPDEIDQGYLGTVMRHNGAVDKKEIVGMMAQRIGLGDKSRREAPCLELLSGITQIDIQTFVRRHSTLPFRRGITSYQSDLKHGSIGNRKLLCTSGMRVARPGAYCCPHCMKQDVMTYGISYWHRKHQLPGLLWCPQHKTPLYYMESEAAFFSTPELVLNNCLVVPDSWMRQSVDNQVINTFHSISLALLDSEKPFSVTHASAILRKQAMARGFQVHGGKVKSSLLSDAVVDAFGREWLATILPRLADKQKSEILNQMDGVLYMSNSASSVVSYVLALSLLFETTETAMSALLAQTDTTATKISSVRATQSIKKEELISAYLLSYGSYSKTATLLTTSYAAICGRLRDMGLPNLRSDRFPGLEKAVIAFYVEEKSLADSAAVGKVACDVLENLVRSAGAPSFDVLKHMSKPASGRGSGTRRPLKLAPHEVDSTHEKLAVKFSPHMKRERRLVAECSL
ncbi:MAG: hypothetical protein FD121_378 [Gallionellaceae bacterium]|nr:MAG: hypothetical protein FD121_378 [Gallionellaceae bacterium]